MKLVVQKFGGTSLKDEESRIEAKKHILAALEEGYKVVVVVSAIGRKGAPYATDSLLSLVGNESTHLSDKELDALIAVGETISASVFTELLLREGIQATFMTGMEAGIITNADFGNAKIEKVNPQALKKELKSKDVVVVTGFQGGTETGSVTTLGRGGSDTTASLLGAALKAEYIDIFTDVRGIMTADPRMVENAEYIETLSYQEVTNMAQNGAKVIHPRAVEIAMQGNVPLRIRGTNEDISDYGTLITKEQLGIEHYRLVTGITHVEELTQFRIAGEKQQQVAIFRLFSEANISVDFINITASHVVVNLPQKAALKAEVLLDEMGLSYESHPHCGKISVVGAGITGVPGVVYQIMDSLFKVGVSVYQAADSHTTIWVLVAQKDLKKAVNVLHNHFFKEGL